MLREGGGREKRNLRSPLTGCCTRDGKALISLPNIFSARNNPLLAKFGWTLSQQSQRYIIDEKSSSLNSLIG